jgi:hypothetical protein
MRMRYAAIAGLVVAGSALFALVWGATDRPASREVSRLAGDLPQLVAPRLLRAAQMDPTYDFVTAPGVASTQSPPPVIVYRVARKQPTRDAVCDLAARAGIPVSAERHALLAETMPDAREYSATVGELTDTSLGDLDVTLSDDGNFMLTVQSQYPGEAKEAPSDETCKASAEAFLARSGLLPEGCAFVGVEEGQAVEFSTPERSETQKRVTGKIVRYHRHLSGLEDGGSFTIRVNGDGKVYGVTRNMRSVIELGRYPVLSTAEAVQAVEAGKGVIVGPAGPYGRFVATIDKVEMVYYEGAPSSNMDTVQPVYVVSGTVDGFADRFKAMLPAVRPEYLAPVTLARP